MKSISPSPSPSPPTGTVTFLFTDIEGSTRLWETASLSMSVALERHDAILRSAVEEHAGVVFSTGGDGLAAAFRDATMGLSAAIAAQRALLSESWPNDAVLRVRMGLNTGNAHERGGDYFGPPVNRAARIMSIAGGGQILVSAATAALLVDAPDVSLIDLGTPRLKGIDASLHVFSIGVDGLDAPAQGWEVSHTNQPTNLPHPTNRWFGSIEEFSQHMSTLADRRGLTIVGPGGIGKTRLAVEMARRNADRYPDGLWMIELAHVVDGSAVVSVVGSTLGVRFLAGHSELETIIDWLAQRRCLLLIDNCEHVAEASARLIEALVQRCPTVSVVATSRQRLGFHGERVLVVPALDQKFAVDMFCDRVGDLDDNVALTSDDVIVVRSICERLDFIPLALELAAARLRFMSIQELQRRLDDRFSLLRRKAPGVSSRHHTLHETIDWSYQLLDERERKLFEYLSAFARWFDLDAAEALAADMNLDVLEILASLVDKSLVMTDRTGPTPRFRLLESIREFAAGKLFERGLTSEMASRHLQLLLGLAEEAAVIWRTANQLSGDAVFETWWDDLRLAHHTACISGDVLAAERLLNATRDHAVARVLSEYGEWTTRTLAIEGAVRPSVNTFGWAAWGALQRGEHDLALELGATGIAVAVNDVDGVICLAVRAFVFWATGNVEAAAEPWQRVNAVLPLLDPWTEMMVLRSLISRDNSRPVSARMAEIAEAFGAPALIASARFYQGLTELSSPADSDAAARFYIESIKLARASRCHLAECHSLQGLQSLRAGQNHPDSVRMCRQALARLYELGYWVHLWRVLATAARHLAKAADIESAGTILGFLEANHLAWGDAPSLKVRTKTMEEVLKHPDGAALLALGATQGRDDIVAQALIALDRAEEL